MERQVRKAVARRRRRAEMKLGRTRGADATVALLRRWMDAGDVLRRLVRQGRA